jgi:hypothetical protein
MEKQLISNQKREVIKIPKEWCYRNIHNSRRANIDYPYENWMIEEIIKCSDGYEGLLYFVENYVYITTLDKGVQQFKLYPFQKRMLKAIYENRFTISKIPRQSGKTTVSGAYLLWEGNFNSETKIGIVANRDKMAREIIKKIQDMYLLLPFWMKQGLVEWNKHEIEFENSSRYLSDATSSNSLRGFSCKILYWDECIFFDEIITIRNKKTGKIEQITIGEFTNRLKQDNITIRVFD